MYLQSWSGIIGAFRCTVVVFVLKFKKWPQKRIVKIKSLSLPMIWLLKGHLLSSFIQLRQHSRHKRVEAHHKMHFGKVQWCHFYSLECLFWGSRIQRKKNAKHKTWKTKKKKLMIRCWYPDLQSFHDLVTDLVSEDLTKHDFVLRFLWVFVGSFGFLGFLGFLGLPHRRTNRNHASDIQTHPPRPGIRQEKILSWRKTAVSLGRKSIFW